MVDETKSHRHPRLIVFDLDGTLIDSAADLCAAVNAMLVHYGGTPLPESVISSFVGEGAAKLVRRALSAAHHPLETSPGLRDQPPIDEAIEYFLDYYHEHKLDRTMIYPGVLASLDKLRSNGNGSAARMAVLTNKPIGPSKAICDALGLSSYFFRIYGGNSFSAKKPDPVGLLKLIGEAGASPDEAVMVGDTLIDILTAQNAGARSIGCSYGMAAYPLEEVGPDRIVSSPLEWPAAIASL